MSHKIFVGTLIAVMLELSAKVTQAHYLWLERDGDGLASSLFR